MIGRADITVLPYPCDTYRANPSGVLCEAAALGKAVIAPSGTWAADQIIDGAAAGVLFDSATRGDAGRATLEALDDLDNLSARARELAPAFRQNNSCRNNLDLMLALAGRRLDMRPACRPGEPIDFSEAYESACYLTEGWGQSEPNAGIWTLGAEARMLLIMDSAPAGAMRLRAQVTPFVAACHPALTVRVEVNGSPVGAWAFTVGESGRTERDAIIPAALFDGAQARVTLHIDSPSSPLALGLSGDGRLLGLMAHTLTLDAVDPTAPG